MARFTQQGVVDPGSPISFLDAAHKAADNTPTEQKASAKQISDAIDAELTAERLRIKANKDAGDIGLLLLGQSESGKSTLLKQFRLIHSLSSFESERSTWRPVILLNVFNTVRNVLSVAKEACERDDPEASVIDRILLKQVEERKAEFSTCEEKLVRMLIRSGHVQSSGQSSQKILMRRQGAESHTFKSLPPSDIRELDNIARTLESMQDHLIALWRDPGIQTLAKQRLQEDWRDYFMKSIPNITSPSYIPTDDDILHVRIMTMGVVEHTFKIPLPSAHKGISFSSPFKRKTTTSTTSQDEGTEVGSMKSGKNGHASNGERASSPTSGKFINMHIYDVGGARGQRHTWASFFEGATAIIFLAPISVFDQFLIEDSEVNRIRDSIELFSKICDNKLLADVQLVLFLNKCDILEQKLRTGIRIRDYIPSFGDQPNTDKNAKKYFAGHFNQVFNKSKVNTNDGRRGLFVHFTSVVDSKATRNVIGDVQDAILQKQMKDAKLI